MDAIFYAKTVVETTQVVQGQLNCMSNVFMELYTNTQKHIHVDIENNHKARTC